MRIGATFYLSRVMGNHVYNQQGKSIGILKDFVVDANAVRPRVIAAKIRCHRQNWFIDYEDIHISKVKSQYRVECDVEVGASIEAETATRIGAAAATSLTSPIGAVAATSAAASGGTFAPREQAGSPPSFRTPAQLNQDGTFLVAKRVLDKQLIDIDGRKLVRVNDVRLAVLTGGTYVVAVDVGFEGLLRRLGVAKPLKKALKPFGLPIPSHLLLWDEVETIDSANQGIRLGKTSAKLSTLHPSDVADILEDLDRKTQLDMFTALDEDTALDVLEELEPDVQASVVEQLPIDQAAAMLEKMPTDEAADIIEELQEEWATQILDAMKQPASDAIRDLMEYPDRSVGSLMTTDFFSFHEHVTVDQVIQALRTAKPEPDHVYYLYTVDESDRLSGTVSLRDLIVSEPDAELGAIADRNIVCVPDTENVDALLEIVAKYNLLAIPVVGELKQLVGVVTINDVVFNLQRNRKGRF